MFRYKYFTTMVVSCAIILRLMADSGVECFTTTLPPKQIMLPCIRLNARQTYRGTRNKYIDCCDIEKYGRLCLRESNNNDDTTDSLLFRIKLAATSQKALSFSVIMTVCGAALGPFLDSYHSNFGVLQYNSPFTAQLWGTADHPGLVTTWWVPFLFGLAGWLIGWLYILIDSAANNNEQTRPTVPNILVGISFFTLQYWLSGVLYQSGIDRSVILNIMSVLAAAGFFVLDNTLTGFIVSTATAIGGPLIEAGLLTMFASTTIDTIADSGYHYTDAGETGLFPLWILPVYFLGGPAVGNLARGVWNGLGTATNADNDNIVAVDKVENSEPVDCEVCNKTRTIPCPNCDGLGMYTAMGGRNVKCTSCRGRGFVICRACFSQYNDLDPNDIQGIREFVSRRPD